MFESLRGDHVKKEGSTVRRYSIKKAIERLNEVGIPIRFYSRAPMGKGVFVIGIGDRYKADERICLWPGMVSIAELSTDKRLGQAVMSVYEEAQDINFTYNINRYSLNNDGTPENSLKRDFRRYAPLSLPENTECINVKTVNVPVPIRNMSSWNEVEVEFTVRTPSEERHFLLGHDTDGTHVFISMLPEKATSVKEAHDILRPSRVPEGSIRQGEFFFLPTPKYRPGTRHVRENGLVYSRIDRVKNSWQTPHMHNWDNRTDHHAEELVVNWSAGIQHVRGIITNPRHEPLVLDVWHKVVANNEVPNPTPTRRWD